MQPDVRSGLVGIASNPGRLGSPKRPVPDRANGHAGTPTATRNAALNSMIHRNDDFASWRPDGLCEHVWEALVHRLWHTCAA